MRPAGRARKRAHTGEWTVQQARNLALSLDERFEEVNQWNPIFERDRTRPRLRGRGRGHRGTVRVAAAGASVTTPLAMITGAGPGPGSGTKGITMQTAMVVTWTHPVPGREEKALAYGAEVMEFWGTRASEGKCSQPEMFFSERGTGLWMVRGDRDTLLQVHDTDEAQQLTLKGELLLEGFCLEFFYAGAAAADYMTRYASALSAIG